MSHAPKHEAQGPEITIALAGQPNCGKSTIFNAVAGFKVQTGNFAGTSVSYTETRVHFAGRSFRLIDLPGTYSISSHDLAEQVARDYLLSGAADVIINVADASLLSRSLEFTLQLIETGIPLVVGLNMIDEARHKGIEIDTKAFKELTDVAAFPVIGVQGRGIDDLFRAALDLADQRRKAAGDGVKAQSPHVPELPDGHFHQNGHHSGPHHGHHHGQHHGHHHGAPHLALSPLGPVYDRDVEACLADIAARYPEALRAALPIGERFVAIRLLEMDELFESRVRAVAPDFLDYVLARRKELAELHGWPERSVFASHRHALVLDLYEQVARVRVRRRTDWREKLDALISSPIGGLAVILGSFAGLFYVSFFLGDALAELLSVPFDALQHLIEALGPGLGASLLSGLVDGLASGAGIALPYLVPLLFLLAIYEDTGFLPRIAFMVDGLLHRVGLHGKSVVPLILGYGCNVPAIMAARNLENERDRKLTLLLIPFVTCSARTVVILALAGKFLGAGPVVAIYLGTMALTLAISFVLSRFNVHLAPGLIMDVPPLRRPYLHIIWKKVWLRLYEFLVFAWPIVIVASVALSLLTYIGIDRPINALFAPFTQGLLNLPPAVGIALFLGIFRKELALLMLTAALGVTDVSSVLSHQQILTLVVFSTLYIPCFATLTMLVKEGGWRTAFYSATLNFSVALVAAAIVAAWPT